MNSIVVYMGSEFLGPYQPFSYDFEDESHWGPLASAALGVFSWNCVASYMYASKLFIKI